MVSNHKCTNKNVITYYFSMMSQVIAKQTDDRNFSELMSYPFHVFNTS